jgi:hypothetical protein
MKNLNSVLSGLVIAMLSGCGAFVPIQDVESAGVEVTGRAAKILVVTDKQAATMQALGEVTGYSCKNLLWDPAASPEDATFQLKLAAVQLGATAISSLSCEEGGVSLLTNCWQSFTCKAMAAK